MKLKYAKEKDIYKTHKIIECIPCCDEMAKRIKGRISESLIDIIVEKCPFCKEKIELICV